MLKSGTIYSEILEKQLLSREQTFCKIFYPIYKE